MTSPISAEQHADLISLINETYLDEVEQILDARVEDNGDILCVALDGRKQLAVRISDTQIMIRMINPQDIDPEGATEESTAGATAGAATPPTPPTGQSIDLSDRLPFLSFSEGEEDAIDSYVQQLQQQAGVAIDRWVAQIRQLLDESSTLADFSERLYGLYPQLSAEQFQQAMGQALVVAGLTGQYEAMLGQ